MPGSSSNPVNQERPSLMSNILGRVVLPLACGGIGGLVSLAFFSPAPGKSDASSAECKDLSAQVSSLQTMIKDLHAGVSKDHLEAGVQPQAAPKEVEPVVAETKQLAQGFLEEAKKMKEQMESRRADREVRETERNKTGAEVELVKLRSVQNTLTLDQTKANVVRRLKRLGLSEPDLATVGELGAPYIRQRSDQMIKILEKVSSGTKVSGAEIQEQLRPSEESFARSLPSNLDETTRHAIATELKSMVDVPYFLRH